VAYSVGGSLASSFSGAPRATLDADIVIDMRIEQADAFLRALGDAFYADADALTRALQDRSTVNVIHQASGIKVDLFVASTPLEALQLQRRIEVTVSSEPRRSLYIHSPEDILPAITPSATAASKRTGVRWRRNVLWTATAPASTAQTSASAGSEPAPSAPGG